jgi:glutaminyl-tRNA synthetase
MDENLDLFERMRAGEFEDGAHVLRAKIDMAHPNLIMRDPTLYRIRNTRHHRTGDRWCIYPMYDFTHCLSDSIEGITHSLCTLEFENNRALYDWVLDKWSRPAAPADRVRPLEPELHGAEQAQIDPAGGRGPCVRLGRSPHALNFRLRRRGYTPEAIRTFCDRIGVAKANSMVDIALLEHTIREDLNRRAPRVMGVLNPLKVVIENYPEGQSEELEAINNPEDASMGTAGSPSRECFTSNGRLHGEPAQEVLPPGTRPGSTAALRLFHHLPGSRQGSRYRCHRRTALHL